jgi:NAD(P)-dependent dehydrogenase (short-subunit alcohol dehydrogenase family)
MRSRGSALFFKPDFRCSFSTRSIQSFSWREIVEPVRCRRARQATRRRLIYSIEYRFFVRRYRPGGFAMKIALVTGASSGIGADAARHLSSRGYRVILAARGRAQLESVAAGIGCGAVIEVCDASSGEQVLAMAERIRRNHGIPDLIVNSAGAGEWKLIEDTSPVEALSMIQAPYLAAFNVTHAFMQDMLSRRSGIVIHVNSPASLFPWPSSVGYAAARWALRGLHESLCQDLVGTGVRSCHIIFGRVNSPYFEHNPGAAAKMPRIARTIRTLSTDECGRVIALLAEKPKRELLHPFTLRFYGWNSRVTPGLVRWLLRITGARRH